MDSRKQALQGSVANDVFKRKHKQELPGWCYALDVDLVLVSKYPPGVVAYIDFKKSSDGVTFTEAMYYNEAMNTAPVYIVESDEPEIGPFKIHRYLGGDWKPEPPDVKIVHEITATDWPEFRKWEISLRQEYTKRNGWSGCLRGYISG